ncbi:MAG: 16S rRNA methyltransferase [Bacteroides sp. SM1_62]|nr:MAG: 16S rRNA methyltransferase [Bacteroides sp. SM23_62]KPL23339.1 MAG: 16S rRNA methyltransferase [Bacteroides sp. SM1_62]
MPVRPKKSLGQHFLKDENIARKIVNSLQYDQSTSILEVGPGTGVLSKYLFSLGVNVDLIEIDKESCEYLIREFPDRSGAIHHGDFLKDDITALLVKPAAVIGNFPYNISSQIFFRILENRQVINQVVCMIQKEVADRVRAPHGSKTYGILSVLLQAWYDIEYLFRVPPQVFDPPPKVQSAVIRLKRNRRTDLGCGEDIFFKVVKSAFNHRRKTLRNSLKSHFRLPITAHEYFSLRPEQLSVAQFIELASLLEDQ